MSTRRNFGRLLSCTASPREPAGEEARATIDFRFGHFKVGFGATLLSRDGAQGVKRMIEERSYGC